MRDMGRAGGLGKAAGALLLLGAAPPPVRVLEVWRDGPPKPRGPALLRAAMLDGHNRARAALGQAPLIWDEALARDAAGYASELARSGRFQHAPQPRVNPQGENLWRGTRGAYGYAEMVSGWVDERRWWKRGPTPDFSTTGRWWEVAHYTQIVWRRTTRLGCALTAGKADEVLVCRYSPAGNVVGVDGVS